MIYASKDSCREKGHALVQAHMQSGRQEHQAAEAAGAGRGDVQSRQAQQLRVVEAWLFPN